MTVRELYAWAEKHDALDLDIEIYDETLGATGDCLAPEIGHHTQEGNTEDVVIL